jgi:hypothetical protein
MIGDPPPMMGVLDRAAPTKAGYEVHITAAPHIVADQPFTTGNDRATKFAGVEPANNWQSRMKCA